MLSSANAFNLYKSNILLFDKGLTLYQATKFWTGPNREFADNNFCVDENGRKLSRCIENTVGKGEIAHCEQFLLFPQCFQKTRTIDM